MRMTRRESALAFSVCLLLGVSAVPNASAQDPGTPGPLAVTLEEYNDGDTAFTPVGFPGPVEVRASVHYPTTLAGGPFPLVVFLHGRHATCFSGGSAFLEWPCSGTRQTIPSFQGYHYTGERLASHGYIVVSISANGINAKDNLVFDLGAQARAELIQHHLNKWNTFSTVGGAPFGTKFVGKVNMSNIGTMGHSRGGEGVMRHVLHNRSLGSPYGIEAVFPLAPVDFNRPIVNDVPFIVLLPYCDGDVIDLQGVHFYDDARYTMAGDITPKHTLEVFGANHNFYNTVWTPGSGFPASDDWGTIGDPHCDAGMPSRLTAAQQRGTGLAYMTGFFRLYLGGETAFAPMFKGDVPPPPSAMSSAIFPSYHAPDAATQRRDVNRLLVAAHLTTNHLGGAVTRSGFTPYDLCGGEVPQDQHCLPGQSTARQPHTTPSARSSARGLSQLRGGWTATTATYTNNLPAGFRDVSDFQVFQFRVAVNFADVRNPAGVAQDFSIRLTDGTGAFSSAPVSSHSPALFYPPGTVGPVPKVVLNTVRIPLTAFGGVDLNDVRSVQFRFDQEPAGALLITDLAFADTAGAPPLLPDLVETAVSNPPATTTPGGSFSVTDTAENPGAAGAGPSTTRYYLSLDATKSGGDVLLTGTRAVPALGVGGMSTGTVTVTVPGATALNTYFLLACADDTMAVSESNENNNCIASATTVQVQAAGGSPDLVETALSSPPAGALVGTKFSVTDTVQNQGDAGAGESKTRYYLSLDATKSSGDTRLRGNRAVPALAAGASSTGSRMVTIKANTQAGTYFLIACADDRDVVAEGAGEGNNCRASATTVVVTGPDLVESALSNPPASATVGGSFSVTDTVLNQGNAAGGASTTRYYLSINTAKGGGDPLLTGTRGVPGLAAGASSSGTVTVTIPGGTSPNSYFLLACADDTKNVAETREKNNCRASASRVTVNP